MLRRHGAAARHPRGDRVRQPAADRLRRLRRDRRRRPRLLPHARTAGTWRCSARCCRSGVIGQAILGALVVKYHLAPGLVMSHFILSMLLLDAAFALAWCSRYETGRAARLRRPARRLGGAGADPARPADDPRRDDRDRLRAPRRRPRGPAGPPLRFRGHRHPGMGRPAPLGDRDRLRPGGDRRLAAAAPPRRRQARPEAPRRRPGPARPAGRRRRRPVGPEASLGDRLGPRRPRHRDLAGDALDGGDRGAARAAGRRRSRRRRMPARPQRRRRRSAEPHDGTPTGSERAATRAQMPRSRRRMAAVSATASWTIERWMPSRRSRASCGDRPGANVRISPRTSRNSSRISRKPSSTRRLRSSSRSSVQPVPHGLHGARR